MKTKIIDFLAKMPSTNARIAITLFVFVATAMFYFLTDFTPSVEWLAFLTVMSGLDAVQFSSKRVTYKETMDETKKQKS